MTEKQRPAARVIECVFESVSGQHTATIQKNHMEKHEITSNRSALYLIALSAMTKSC